ncbi:reverse transcriptase domain, reverse transcriptase zinc-binding domain protein [Tanacetum coccineum]|uniref:Reverse transcriptase domain, reverse transcriptase zinc-binding domain protein n=1 Tax=Tanacetum coccineum TaxID=301880 RepID=A0ABQ4YU09_9ASTR
MYHPTYEPPSPSPQPNQVYSPLNRLNLDVDMENLFSTKEYYASQGSDHDYYVGQGSDGNQEFYTGQDYSMGHGSAPVEDDSPVEEVAAPAKGKKVSKRLPKTVQPKEGFKMSPWTIADEIVLCQAWCDVSENSITGNTMKSKGFWLKVIEYFKKETGSNQGYDSILNKWKNRVRPRIGAFCAIFDNVRRRNKSGSCDLTVYQKACVEYATEYDHEFSLEPCWQILKNHHAWKQVETLVFYSKQNPGSKKAKTSETTSSSAQGGLNLNEDAAGSEEEVREVRPMGRDRARAKKSSISSRSEASSAGGGGIVDMVADK